MTLCKSVISLSSQEGCYPYLKEHGTKWSNKDIKLYVWYLALFMTNEEHDKTCSHLSFLLSYRLFLEQQAVLLYRRSFHASEDITGVQGKQTWSHARETCEHGDRGKVEKQNLYMEQQRGCEARAGEPEFGCAAIQNHPGRARQKEGRDLLSLEHFLLVLSLC